MSVSRWPVLDRRRSGLLLHPSSLAGGPALGVPAHEFVDWLASAGFTVWQMLPPGPPGADGSPYRPRSDHAGNTRWVDPSVEPEGGQAAFDAFCRANAHWLDDYALFEAIATAQGRGPWWDWPEGLRDREPHALADALERHATPVWRIKREQWQFDDQWRRLRSHAHSRGVRLFGDLPLYAAPDSVSVWAHRDQFQFDAHGRPAAVAGLPPDESASDGRLWGNPLYAWDRMQADGFAYWRSRIRAQLGRFDLLRIEHFRGLVAYWSVPAGASTARAGAWRDAPGYRMLESVRRDLQELPLVADDQAAFTQDVDALRTAFGIPGTRVLQRAFSGGTDSPHLPHNLCPDAVVHTGTHDTDTTQGWYAALDEAARRRLSDYLGLWDGDRPDALERAALASVARLAILPMQDILRLGSEARLNLPGTVNGNWNWRMPAGCLTASLAGEYRELNALYGRS
ncbi:MAG: hypothetical protein RLZZ393_298 [Pseudomonadota bacterium]